MEELRDLYRPPSRSRWAEHLASTGATKNA